MKHSRLFLILSLFFSLLLILLVPLVKIVQPFLPFADYLLGTQQPATYLVLLGNDTEMRANGGFVGSYAKITLRYPQYDLSFQDIYVPNGQLKGYVTPPAPIQEAFQHGTWQLANADWEPDFPTAATSIRWFMEKGGEINPDNLVMLNLSTIKKILNVVGSFQVDQYQAEITPDNLYLFLQGKAELNFFPGSTQKKDVLTAVGSALSQKVHHLSLLQKIRLAQIFYTDLQNQNFLIHSQNTDFQALLEKYNYAGKLTAPSGDAYLLVETNLGANKANAYVTRQTSHDIVNQNGLITHQTTIHFSNSSPESRPNPPFHYGGDYKAYLRFYLPSNLQNLQIASPSAAIKDYSLAYRYGFTEIGFWNTTPAQSQTTLTLSYSLPPSSAPYTLILLKQHSFVSSPQTIRYQNQTSTTPLTNDFVFTP